MQVVRPDITAPDTTAWAPYRRWRVQESRRRAEDLEILAPPLPPTRIIHMAQWTDSVKTLADSPTAHTVVVITQEDLLGKLQKALFPNFPITTVSSYSISRGLWTSTTERKGDGPALTLLCCNYDSSRIKKTRPPWAEWTDPDPQMPAIVQRALGPLQKLPPSRIIHADPTSPIQQDPFGRTHTVIIAPANGGVRPLPFPEFTEVVWDVQTGSSVTRTVIRQLPDDLRTMQLTVIFPSQRAEPPCSEEKIAESIPPRAPPRTDSVFSKRCNGTYYVCDTESVGHAAQFARSVAGLNDKKEVHLVLTGSTIERELLARELEGKEFGSISFTNWQHPDVSESGDPFCLGASRLELEVHTFATPPPTLLSSSQLPMMADDPRRGMAVGNIALPTREKDYDILIEYAEKFYPIPRNPTFSNMLRRCKEGDPNAMREVFRVMQFRGGIFCRTWAQIVSEIAIRQLTGHRRQDTPLTDKDGSAMHTKDVVENK